MIQLDTNQFDTTGAASGILVLMVCVLRWRPPERAGTARELQ